MDFYIQKQDIVKALSLTLCVVEKRQTLPILSNVLIEVDEGSRQLTATDGHLPRIIRSPIMD